MPVCTERAALRFTNTAHHLRRIFPRDNCEIPEDSRAVSGVLKFGRDRVMLDTKTGSRYRGGGFGPTVQLDDGTPVTSCSYRGEDDKTHLEVIRWTLPAGKLVKGAP